MDRRSKKRNHKAIVAVLGTASLALAGCGNIGHSPNQSITLTLSAAISLKGPLQAIGQQYHHRHPDQRIACNFGASGTLQHQIEQGAPVDIFISAGEEQMDALEKKELIVPGTRRDLLSNQMALIVPAGSHKIKVFADLRQRSVGEIAIGNPEIVPAGMYAKQALEHMRLWRAIQRKLVFAADVRQALMYVETGNADAGLVYVTDARITSAVRVVALAPGGSHQPILYPVALLASSKSPQAARSFLDVLESPESLDIFEKAGFGAAAPPAPEN